MNFDKESKSEEKKFFFGWGVGGGRGERGGGEKGIPTEVKTQKKIFIRLFFVLMLYIKF